MRYFYIKVVSASVLVMFTCLASAEEKLAKLKVSYDMDLLSIKAINVCLPEKLGIEVENYVKRGGM